MTGSNGERYPTQFDTFIPVCDVGHYHVAIDYKLLFAVIRAIQTELGVGVSGNAGTLAARLYGQGNINHSGSAIGYDRFQRGWITTSQANFTDAPVEVVDLSSKNFDGVDNGWGDGLPIVFGRVGKKSDDTGFYTSGAWRLVLVDKIFRQQHKWAWAGRLISGSAVSAADTTNIYLQYVAINWKMPF